MVMTKLTYGSLFTGVGGFDLGFDQQGYDCQWQVEWDQHCQQVLQYHWPEIPHHHDVRDVQGDLLAPVDVLTFGSPCQDLSVAGRRAGLVGEKSSMFHEAVRIIEEMRNATNRTYPRIAVWENVPGAFTSNKGRDFHTVLSSLENIGAMAQWWRILDAQYFGVAQRRRRLFLIAVFDPAIAERIGTGPILPLGERRTGHPTSSRPTQHAAATVATLLPGADSPNDRIVGPLDTFGRISNQSVRMGHLVIPFHPHFAGGVRIQGDTINTITARWGTGGNNGVMIAETGRVRRLTPLECERLMGWPDNHTLHRADGKTTSNGQRYKMCGNGVVAPVASWIAKHLRPLLDTP